MIHSKYKWRTTYTVCWETHAHNLTIEQSVDNYFMLNWFAVFIRKQTRFVHKEFNTIDFFHTCFVGFSDWQLYGGDVKFLGRKQKNGKIIPNNNEKLGAGGGKTFEFSKDSMVRFQAENCWNLREKALAFSVKTGKRMIWSQKCMWNENKLDSKKKFHPIQKETRREENIQKLCKYFISSNNSISCNSRWSQYFGEFHFFFLVFFIRSLLPRFNSLFDSKCAGEHLWPSRVSFFRRFLCIDVMVSNISFTSHWN